MAVFPGRSTGMDLADYVETGMPVHPWPASWLPDFKNRAYQYRKRFRRALVARGFGLAAPCVRVYWTSSSLYSFDWLQQPLPNSAIEARNQWIESVTNSAPAGVQIFHDDTDSPTLPWCVLLRVPTASAPWKWWHTLHLLPSNLEIRIESFEGRRFHLHLHLVTWTQSRGLSKYDGQGRSDLHSWLVAKVGHPRWLPRSVYLRLSSYVLQELQVWSGS